MLVTVEDLLGHAGKKENNNSFRVYITELDKEVECYKISRKEYIDLVFSSNKDEDLQIVYSSCPIFRNEELIKKLKCTMNPTEVIEKILSTSTIYSLSKLVLKESEIEVDSIDKFVKKMDDDIKN